MKAKYLIPAYLLLFSLCYIASSYINNSYSLTCDTARAAIEKENGKYVVNYYCEDINTHDTYKISMDDAINLFNASKYQAGWTDEGTKYFYMNNEISESQFDEGIKIEQADYYASAWGAAGIRVHNTQELKNSIDNIYNNKKFGEFHFVFAENESVNVAEAYNYYASKYGLDDVNRNYYRYSLKGEQEPIRFKFTNDDLAVDQQFGEFILDTYHVTSMYAPLRITTEQKNYTEQFVNKLVPILTAGASSDAEKVWRAAKYIHDTTQYHDLTTHQILVEGQTSIYNAFIERKSVCIGFSIAFSYLMDKMGIESYIVDMNSVNNGTYTSTHTYNIVKINGKMYQVDVTSGSNISGISGGLSANSFNISTTGINTNNFNLYDTNAANNLYNQYRGGVSAKPSYTYVSQPNFGTTGPKNVNGTRVYNDVNYNTQPDDHTTTTRNQNDPNNSSENPYNNNNDSTTTTTYNPNTRIIKITNEVGEVVATTQIQINDNNVINHTSTIIDESGSEKTVYVDDNGTVLGVIEEPEQIINEDEQHIDKQLITNVLIIVAVTLVIILIILFIRDKMTNVKVNMGDL